MDKVKALRAQMKKYGVQGFIIPSSDEFQGEYVPAHARRLKWLTDFDGSAGAAVVLEKKAAFFTDGRYTLQAATQLEGKPFTIFNSGSKPFPTWLKEEAKGVVGYDPWLHTPSQVRWMKRFADEGDFKLKPVPNLVDACWKDQPRPGMKPALVHEERYSGKPSADKRKDLVGLLKEKNAAAVLLTAPDSICWLLNIRGQDVPRTPFLLSYAIVYATGRVVLFVPTKKITKEVRKHLGPAVQIKLLEEKAILSELAQTKGKVVLADPSGAASWFFDALKKVGARIQEGEDPCLLPKAMKNPVELAGMRRAHERDAAAVIKLLAWLEKETRKGELTELDVVKKLEDFRRESDMLKDLSFDTIAGFGPNGAIVHYRATEKTNRAIKPGSLLLLDSGGQYPDGTTDITRTVAIGKPKPKHREHFTRVLKGHIRLARARFPEGTTGGQLDALARFSLWQAGLDYDHGTGHGVGSYLSVHEGPQRISKGGTAPLKEGMIISNEPGYYEEGSHGIRIESLVAVKESRTGDGKKFLDFETITLVPLDRRLVDKKMMNMIEIRWLNLYHKRVYETLAARLPRPARLWLRKATRPI
jgi:Xaa-Pro aminopeptidase